MKKNLLVTISTLLLFLVRLSAQTVITDTTAGSSTWLCPAGVTSVIVECWGGGGGGGFAKYQYTAAGSGAGGSYINYTMPVTPGTTYYIYVGAGGSGGKDSITPGSTGGSSYFGSTTDTLPQSAVVLAVGGIGGNSVDSSGAKGAPDSATGGAAVSSGNLPLTGFRTSLYGAAGGSATFTGATAGGVGANGGAGGAASTNFAASKKGYNGLTPGGGGSGAIDKTVKAGEVGGNGGVGEVQLTYVTATSVFKPSSFSAVAFSSTQINLAATSNANNNNIVVVYSRSLLSFVPPTNGIVAGAAGSSFIGGIVVYNGAASGLNNHTGLAPGFTYYYEVVCYDASNNYSPVVSANATTLVSNIINTDFTGTTPNYFSGVSTQAASIIQTFGVGVLNQHYAMDTGFAIGTESDTTPGLMPIDTSIAGNSYTLGFAVKNGWYVDYKIAPTTGYSLNVSSIAGIMQLSGAASTNNFGVLYGVGTASTPPTTFYNSISNTQSVDTGKGTPMSSALVHFSSITSGVNLTGTSYLTSGQVLYVRIVLYRAYLSPTVQQMYHAGLTIGGTYAIDLPVSIAKFGATKINTTTASVSWSVVSATNVKEFEVTKSTDGKNFKSIGTVAFSGTKSYTFNDNNLIGGTSYYRLVAIDKDWATHYSSIAAVVNKTSGIAVLSLAPNLVHSITMLNISSAKADNVTIRIIDLLGRTIQQKGISIPEGNSQTSFNFSTLKAGSYFLQTVSTDGSVNTTRFEKQ